MVILNAQDLYHIESLKADLPNTNVKMKELENDVNELRSELDIKSREIQKLRDENKVLINKCIQQKNKDLNESGLEMISQSSLHDNFTSKEKDDLNEKDLEIFLQSAVPDSLTEESALKKDSEMLSQSCVPKPLKHDLMVCDNNQLRIYKLQLYTLS